MIEDNLETRFIHTEALRNSDCVLKLFKNVTDADAALQHEMPAAIVLDRMLGGEDSLPFLRSVRENGFMGKVLVVSVMDEPEAAIHAGADAFLPKPIAYGLLAETLSKLLSGDEAKSLLLVDDDESNRYILREALLPFHLHLLEARTGHEALQTVGKQVVHAIFWT